jgi:hypothetical protein
VALILVGLRGKLREQLTRRRFRHQAQQEVPGVAATPAELMN